MLSDILQKDLLLMHLAFLEHNARMVLVIKVWTYVWVMRV